ncbi:unnamed protein product [Medioppia subpectinata]|uniref:Tyrosyl-DNA phosphodiesterase 2 n=1 Tax=Medioppia subpectinata TaxID=1979941 RepID=A0A7R9L0I2_9ACAR|nr:unnamed protein product [Medioppia subpectinata]CAG2113095.1 unnamed protein product [Medioppia subpectinata]
MATNDETMVETIDDGDDGEDVPSVEICQQLVEEFVRLTETDEALAQFYLQDRRWDLQLSVGDYFDQQSQQQSLLTTTAAAKRAIAEVAISSSDDSNDCDVVYNAASAPKRKVTEIEVASSSSAEPEVETNVKDFGFLCWNIDGIDEKNLRLRTESVAKHIKDGKAVIVFLQEVIKASEEILRQSLPDYEFFSGNQVFVEYYTMTLIHKKYVKLVSNEVIGFSDSVMGRNLLKTRVSIGNASLCLLNTHLESTKDFADIRVQQLRTAFREMCQMEKTSTVIFGGDLNLRDVEVQNCGGIPSNVYDVWIKTGARKEVEYTWDMTRNDNLQFNSGSRFKPRFRFDRVFVRPSTAADVEAIHFGLTGLTRLKPSVCFPSDHWGLTVHFSIH